MAKRNRIKKPRPNVWKKEHCPTYHPDEGFGSVKDWTSSFRTRMGLDEAVQVLGDDDPLTILGLSDRYTKDELKRAYRKLAMQWHPDRHAVDDKDQAERMFKKVTAAYVKLGGRD